MNAILHVTRIEEPLSYGEGLQRQIRVGEALLRDPARRAELLLLQHEPVYTLGRATKPDHLLGPPEALAQKTGVRVVQVERGGSITYHGPGQLTAYLLLNLKCWDMAIHQHLWNLEEAAIRTLRALGLEGQRVEGMTGVWAGRAHSIGEGGWASGGRSGRPDDGAVVECPSSSSLAKVCAIGVGCRRWVTYHGLGLNVDLDLAPFVQIDPCGLGRKPVTNLSLLLGRSVGMEETQAHLVEALADLLDATLPLG